MYAGLYIYISFFLSLVFLMICSFLRIEIIYLESRLYARSNVMGAGTAVSYLGRRLYECGGDAVGVVLD